MAWRHGTVRELKHSHGLVAISHDEVLQDSPRVMGCGDAGIHRLTTLSVVQSHIYYTPTRSL